MIYGGGSIKKNGIYDQVMELLKESGKVVIKEGGYKVLNHDEVLDILKASL